jgi:hypothetical protein
MSRRETQIRVRASMSAHGLRIEDLERWVLSGAHWRVVDMCTCMGEPMERVESDDPAVIGYLRTAHSELDGS